MSLELKTRVLTLLAACGLAFPSAGYEPVEVASPGTVEGVVRFAGEVPAVASVEITKDVEVCGKSKRDVIYRVGKEGGLANVIVELMGVKKGKAIESKELVIDQKGCDFIPRVSVLPVGSTILFLNSDPVLHTARATDGKKTVLNIALPIMGFKVPRQVKRKGHLRFQCDVGHQWMRAWTRVTDHPYVMVTGDDGHFELTGVPAGKYTLSLWHEGAGEKSIEVEVTADGTTQVAVDF